MSWNPQNITQTYDYLVKARRDFWTALQSVPDEVLSRPLLNGERFHSIKDLVFHIPDVEDGWIHMDILRDDPVQKVFPALQNIDMFSGAALGTLLDYWRAVEQSTQAYLAILTDSELQRIVTLHDAPEERYTADGLLWHVMTHEMRHTAQVCVLLRAQGIKPPWLDLLRYLPSA